MTRPFSRRELVLPLALSLVTSALVLLPGPRLYDDAYITLRYARNLALGQGFVYNPGERVLGTSAPLFGLLAAVLSPLTGPGGLPRAAFALDALCLPLLACLVYRLVRRAAGPGLSLVTATAALAPLESLRLFASGMETPLYLVGIVLALDLLARKRDAWALGLSGLLPFLHPDAVLLWPCLLLAIRLRDGRWPLKAGLAGLAPLLEGTAVLVVVFGSPLPQSVRAKAVAYVASPGFALSELATGLVDGILPSNRLPALPRGVLESFVGLVIPVLLGALVLSGRAGLRSPAGAAASLFAVAYLVAFAAGNPFVFPWYLAPLCVPALVAAAFASGEADRRLAAAWGLLLATGAGLSLAGFRPYDTSSREDLYRRAVRELGLGPSDLVSGPEVGALGWETRARVLDTEGLVSPVALAFHDPAWRNRPGAPSIHGGEIPPRLIREAAPQYLVALTRFLEPALAADPHVLDRYDLVALYPSWVFGSRGVAVYRRKN